MTVIPLPAAGTAPIGLPPHPDSAGAARILVLEDDALEAQRLAAALAHQGHQVTLAGDGDAALAALERAPFDLVLADLVVPGLDGLGLIRALAARGIDVPVIACVTPAGIDGAAGAIRLGACDFVVKPVGALRLQVSIANALRRKAPAPAARAEPAPSAAGGAVLALLDPAGHARSLEEMEREAIRFALSLYGGHMSEAARRLGIGRSTLYRKLGLLEDAPAGHAAAEQTAPLPAMPVAAE